MAKVSKKNNKLNKTQINYLKKKFNVKKIQDLDITVLKSLKEWLKKLKDTRMKNKILYKLWDVIMCVIIASFADNNDWEEIHDFVKDNYSWFKSFLQMTGGVPTASSYERIMSLVDYKELNDILLEFFKNLTFSSTNEVDLMNFDGRVNNGSKRNETIESKAKSPLNCLNVYYNRYGYCIETKPIADKTNEIPTIKELIIGMNLTGTIVTWDALNSQTTNTEAVINAGGDYVIPIKGNQATFYKDLIDYFDEDRCGEIIAGNSDSAYLRYVEKSHSSYIVYECFQTSDIKWYDKLDNWKKVATFGMVRKTIVKKEKVRNERKNAKTKTIIKEITTTEKRYYISSRQVNINEFSIATRNHWAIENKVHWHLDFTFCQDKNTTTNKNALLNLEIIHKFVLATLNHIKPYYNCSLKRIRKHLSRNFEDFFPELLCYLALK